MKFLLDENLSKKLALFLQQIGHSVLRVRKINPGGELVFKEKLAHCGVILLRLQDETPDNTIKAIQKLISQLDKIKNHFVVVTEKEGKFKIRVNKL